MRIASLSEFLLQKMSQEADAASARSKHPANRRIYQLIRGAILARLLPPGLQLPSSRDLATELKLSRNTVLYAYEQLLAEGYLETRTGAGTFVTDTIPDQVTTIEVDPRHSIRRTSTSAGLTARGQLLVEQAGVGFSKGTAFMTGMPDVSRFPNQIWSRLQNKVWRRARPDLLGYGQPGGYLPLREQIAEYLRLARSVNCSANQVIITTGAHQSIDLAGKLLAEPGDRAWIEDPCYWGTRSVLRALDIEAVPIKTDNEGMQLSGRHAVEPPRFIFTTPSHQYPLGTVMSLARRRAFLEYAAAHKVWVLEDDYDSEFRYGSRPLASLQGMDTNERVLYIGSFSKTLFPGLRIGFIVVPERLAEPFAIGLSELYRGGQVYTQAVLAEFMEEGHFSSHIRRMRLLYGERLRLLQDAVASNFGDQINADGDAGLHLALTLSRNCDDVAIAAEAREHSIIVRPLSTYYMDPKSAQPGLMLGYAGVPNEQIKPAFDILATIIRNHWR